MRKSKSNAVLLADSSKTFLAYAGILLKRLGYQTYLARDGAEAVKLAKEKNPSIIVLDYMIPDIDGSSCLSIIRNDAEIKDIPVVILSSYDSDSAKDKFEKLGTSGFIRKPINISELHSTIRGCLRYDNKRINIRVPLRLRVVIECQNERRELFACNLSYGGMFLRTVAPFDIGTEMNIIFAVDEEDPIEIKAKVIYSNKLSTEIEQEPGMGIKFLKIPEDVRCRIACFVMGEIANDLTIECRSIDEKIDLDAEDISS